MKLWLVPASDTPATSNLPKTLSQPISEARRKNAGLSGENFLHAWGAKSGPRNDTTLERMERGDLCLFFTLEASLRHKQYNWSAKVLEVRRSAQISEALWDTPDSEWVYFLEEPSKINLSVEQLATKLERYRPNYFSRAPIGIVAVDPDVIERVIRDHGSLENWLKQDLQDPARIEGDFLDILRRYQSEHTVFLSSARNMRYAIDAVDATGATVRRLDAS